MMTPSFILDDRGIDTNWISRGVSGLVDNHCFSVDSISRGMGGLVNNHIDIVIFGMHAFRTPGLHARHT